MCCLREASSIIRSTDMCDRVKSVVYNIFPAITVPTIYLDQRSVRNVRAHREMVIHNECTGFVVLKTFALLTTILDSKYLDLAETCRPTNQC